MKQAQQMQQRMARVQQELEARQVEASAGGGMVTAVVTGKMQLVSLKIEKDVVDPEDVDMYLFPVRFVFQSAGQPVRADIRR